MSVIDWAIIVCGFFTYFFLWLSIALQDDDSQIVPMLLSGLFLFATILIGVFK